MLYPDIVIIMCSNPVHVLLNSNAITTKNLSNQDCNTTWQGKRHNNFKYCNSQSGCINFFYTKWNSIIRVFFK